MTSPLGLGVPARGGAPGVDGGLGDGGGRRELLRMCVCTAEGEFKFHRVGLNRATLPSALNEKCTGLAKIVRLAWPNALTENPW
jgi:hypothetical protein